MEAGRAVGEGVVLRRILDRALTVDRAHAHVVGPRPGRCPGEAERHPRVVRQRPGDPCVLPARAAIERELHASDAARARERDPAHIDEDAWVDGLALGRAVDAGEGTNERVLVPAADLPVAVVRLDHGPYRGEPLWLLHAVAARQHD